MSDSLIEQIAAPDEPQGRRFYGVAVATVLENVEIGGPSGQGRVQVSLPWMPEIAPWARVAAPMAGPDTGIYFLPQPGDEVLVAFHHGDVNEPFVIGSLWNAQDLPPAETPYDPQFKFRIRTPLGHSLEFDDLEQKVTLTTTTEHELSFSPTRITLKTIGGTASVELGVEGDVTVTAATQLKLKSLLSVSIEAPKIELKGSDVSVNAAAHCGIKAAMVDIN